MRLLSASLGSQTRPAISLPARGGTAEAFPAGGDRYQLHARQVPACIRRLPTGARWCAARFDLGGGSGLSEVDAASRRGPPFVRFAHWRTRRGAGPPVNSPCGYPFAMRHYGTPPPLRSSGVQRSACRRDPLFARGPGMRRASGRQPARTAPAGRRTAGYGSEGPRDAPAGARSPMPAGYSRG